MLSMAAPAPIKSTFLFFKLIFLDCKSSMNPVPSVESSTYFLFFIEIVFTALICLASGEMLPSS